MEKKYIIDESESKTYIDFNGKGHIVYRIVAEKDIYNEKADIFISAGTKGGWIEKTARLSQDGTCFLCDDSVLLDTSFVFGDAILKDQSVACGESKIFDYATVGGKSRISGKCRVHDYTTIEDDTILCGNVHVCENTYVSGKHIFEGDIKIKNSRIEGESKISSYPLFSPYKTIVFNSHLVGLNSIEDDVIIRNSKIIDSKLIGTTEIKNSTIRNSSVKQSNICNTVIMKKDISKMQINENKSKSFDNREAVFNK